MRRQFIFNFFGDFVEHIFASWLVIAFNYKYVLDGLKNMEDEKVLIGLNTKASPTVFRPDSENDYISLVMPVQIR